MAKEKKKSKGEEYAGLAFVGFLMIGLGMGFIFNQIPAGLFIGMGIGFLAMVRLRSKFDK